MGKAWAGAQHAKLMHEDSQSRLSVHNLSGCDLGWAKEQCAIWQVRLHKTKEKNARKCGQQLGTAGKAVVGNYQ